MKNERTSTADLIKKTETLGDTSLRGLINEVESLKSAKGLPQKLAERYDRILQKINAVINDRLTRRKQAAEERLAQLQAEKPKYDKFAEEIETKQKERAKLQEEIYTLNKHPHHKNSYSYKITYTGRAIKTLWDAYITAMWGLLYVAIPVFTIPLWIALSAIVTVAFLVPTIPVAIWWVPCKIGQCIKYSKYKKIENTIKTRHIKINSLDKTIKKRKTAIKNYEDDILAQERTITQCDEEFIN